MGGCQGQAVLPCTSLQGTIVKQMQSFGGSLGSRFEPVIALLHFSLSLQQFCHSCKPPCKR